MRLTQKSCTFWLVVTAVLVGSTSLAYPRTLLDSPLCTYIADALLHGKVLYRDVWDPRAPGVFLAYALQIALLGKSAVAMRAFDVLWQLATALTLFSIGVRIHQKNSVGLIAGVAYLIAYFSQNFWHWAEPDTFLTLPLALSFLFLLRGLRSQRGSDWFFAAVFVAVAALFKLPYGLFGVLALLAAARTARGDVRQLARRIPGLALGLAMPLLLLALYFLANGAWHDFLKAQFVYGPAYLAEIREVVGFREFLGSAFRPVLVPFYVMAVLGLLRYLVRLRGADQPHLAETLLVGWLGVGVVAIFLHGSFLGYHYLALFAPASLLFAGFLHEFGSIYRSQPVWRSGIVVLLLAVSLAVSGNQLRRHALFVWKTLHGQVTDAPWRELGSYIQQRTSPEDKIFVWGNVPVMYLHADREAASRFLCTAYLTVRPESLGYADLLLEDLNANRPVFFVLFKEGSITPALPDSLRSYEMLPALKRWVENGYDVEKETDLYVLYHRR